MKPTKTAKTFDAVAMVRDIREQIYEETKHMTPEERIAYFRKHSEAVAGKRNSSEKPKTR